MNESVRRGHLYIIAVIAIMVGVSLFTIAFTTFINGAGAMSRQAIRFALTLGLCLMLYQGRPWARWVIIVLTTLAMFSSILSAFAVMQVNVFAAIALLIMSVLYFIVGGLLFSPSVKSYFQAQRQQQQV